MSLTVKPDLMTVFLLTYQLHELDGKIMNKSYAKNACKEMLLKYQATFFTFYPRIYLSLSLQVLVTEVRLVLAFP